MSNCLNIQFVIDTVNNIPDVLLFRNHMFSIYPNYTQWIHKCKKENRETVIAYVDNKIVGFIIFKVRLDSVKLCQIFIKPEMRKKGVGFKLLSYFEEYAKHLNTTYIYTTINQENKQTISFFEKNNYLLIDIATYGDFVYQKCIAKAILSHSFVLMSLKPQYWSLIVNRKKSVELRRKVWKDSYSHVVIYVSQPISRIVGVIAVKDIVTDSIDKIKSNYLQNIAITERQFSSYINGKDEVSVIRFKRLSIFENMLSLDCIGIIRPPQNYCFLTKEQIKVLLEKGGKIDEEIY